MHRPGWGPLESTNCAGYARSIPATHCALETEIIGKRQSQSKPDMGSYQSNITVLNQDNIAVLTMTSTALIRVRGKAAA